MKSKNLKFFGPENLKDFLKNKILPHLVISMIVLLVLMSLVQAQSPPLVAVSRFPQLAVTLINQEPDPIAPGSMAELKFRIENEGGSPAEDVQAKLILKYPFSLYGEEEIKNLGTIAGSQTEDIGVREEWELLVDSGATTGDHTVEFWYKIKGGVWTKAGEYGISVRSRDPILAIKEIRTDRENIVPGTMTKVSIVLENLADNTLNGIKLNMGVYTTLTTTTSITFLELPFTPIGTGNENTLKKLVPGETHEMVFNFFTDADAESKAYKIPYTLTYSDASGTNFSRTGIMGVLVKSTPDLSVNIESTEIYSAGSKGRVEIKLVNKGFSDIKFLDVMLTETAEFQIISNPNSYIGELDSDDYESAEYTLVVDKGAEDPLILPLKIEYRDGSGELYTKELPLELRLLSGAELKQRANGGGFPWGIIILVIVIAMIAYFIYKGRKNKKRKAKG